MPETLTLALVLARSGYHVFPLQRNGKKPLAGSSGFKDATTSEGRIKAWAELHPGCNWGIACEPSGLAVVDVDDKDGKSGSSTLAVYEVENGDLAPFMTVYTPSGGRHLYFRGTCPSSQGDRGGLGPGLDTRGTGGYVVAPGCVTSQGKYRIEGSHLRRAEEHPHVPEWITEHLTRAAAPQADVSLDLDDEQRQRVYDAACDWLANHADPAIEGQGGDQTTYETACRMRDMGLEPDEAILALDEHYNPRCEPPWDIEDLQKKVENAYKYAKSTHGIFAAEAVFEPIDDEPEEVVFQDDPWQRRREAAARIDERERSVKRAVDIDPTAIPPREWVLGHRLIRDYITVTVSPGGVGKSVLTTLEGLAVASGQDLTGDKVHCQGPVLLISTEDPGHEVERRLVASCTQHKIPLAALRDVHYLSAASDPMRLVVPGDTFGEVVVNHKEVKWLIDYITRHHIVAVIADPFVRTHMIDENNNMAVDAVAQCFSRIALEAHCAVNIVHHTRKRGDSGGRGNAELARGASALINACRVAHTLDTMDTKEAEEFGIPEEEKRWWLRLDDAKSNLAPPADAVRWFHRESITLSNGDRVGTMRIVEAGELVARAGDELALAAALLALYDEDPLEVVGKTPNALGRLLQTRSNVMPGASEDKVRRALVKIVEKGLALPDGRILRLAPAGGGRGRRVVEVVTVAGSQGGES